MSSGQHGFSTNHSNYMMSLKFDEDIALKSDNHVKIVAFYHLYDCS